MKKLKEAFVVFFIAYGLIVACIAILVMPIFIYNYVFAGGAEILNFLIDATIIALKVLLSMAIPMFLIALVIVNIHPSIQCHIEPPQFMDCKYSDRFIDYCSENKKWKKE